MDAGVDARLGLLERATQDNSEVRERGKRNERAIDTLRSDFKDDVQAIRDDHFQFVADVREDIKAVREDVQSMYRAFITAAISFVLASAGIIATLVALFK